MSTTELARSLKALISSDDDCEAGIRLICAAIKDTDADIEIETDDGAAENLNNDDTAWVTSEHSLVIDGETVAEWRRCARGHYGDQGRSEMVGVWCTEEDTDGGDGLPDAVEYALDALGIEDDLPAVPEPDAADEEHAQDAEGEYAVYWETVGDDEGVLARYSDLDAARAVCAQWDRQFRQRNPSGGGTTMLCGHSVRQLIDGQWQAVEEE